MDKERTVIDQKLCDTVRMMMAGKDAKVSQVVELLGISQATVNRIRQAGYSLEQFNKDKSSRNERKKELKEQRAGNTLDTFFTKEAKEAAINMPLPETEPEQVPGQICMDLQPAEEKKEDTVYMLRALFNQQTNISVNQGKIIEKLDAIFIGMEGMHRYRAGKTELLSRTLGIMLEKLDKLNDTMNQILRRMDK